MAGIDERRPFFAPPQGRHQVAAPGQHFKFAQLKGLSEIVRKLRRTLADQLFEALLDGVLVAAGVRALYAHELAREPPSEFLVDHLEYLTICLGPNQIVCYVRRAEPAIVSVALCTNSD